MVADGFPLSELSEHLQADCVVWVDLCRPSMDDVKLVAEELDLHHLALEDALSESQRPKVDRYRSHLFLTVYETEINPTTRRVVSRELSVFVTAHSVVTVHQDPTVRIGQITERWDASSEDLVGHGVAFLLHGLLDHAVDSYFATVEALDDGVDELEELVFAEDSRVTEVQRRSYLVRRNIVELRRVALPMREVVNTLMRRDLHVVNEELAPYYQDVYDHVLRVSDWTDTLRDLITTVLETNLTVQGNRLNETMKQITAWAAIVAVPTAVTGYFGQNVPYPGFGHWSGFVASSLVIVLGSLGLYIAFRRRDWL